MNGAANDDGDSKVVRAFLRNRNVKWIKIEKWREKIQQKQGKSQAIEHESMREKI